MVDDEPMVVDALREILAAAGYETLGATSFEDGRRLLLAPPVPDVVVADVRLGKYNGLQLVVLRPQATAAIVISGHWDEVLEAEARLLVTDSGGIQEETSVLGTPCLTYRNTTERPITIELGTNELVGVDPKALREAAERVLGADPPAEPPQIPLWDGHAGPRAAAAVERYLAQKR